MHGIYLIADFSFPAARIFDTLSSILNPKIALLQYRNKQANPTERKQHAEKLKALCKQKNIPLIINDDIQLALEINADGVHLGCNDTLLPKARALLGTNKIIGISCYASIEQARSAQAGSADYVAFGSVFPSATKPQAPLISLQDLSVYKKQLNLPICAIGGINDTNIHQVFSAGADMAAMISHIWQASDPAKTLNNILRKTASLNADFKQCLL